MSAPRWLGGIPYGSGNPIVAKRDSTLYMVWWPRNGVFKVGITNRAERVRLFESTGGIVLHTVPHATRAQEKSAQQHVGYAFDRAFSDASEATELLGKGGGGFTECFVIGSHTIGAIELACLGISRASG